MTEEKPISIKKKAIPNPLLKQARLALTLTQADLAEALDVADISTISDWENGVNNPSIDNQRKLCNFFQKIPVELGLLPEEIENGETKTSSQSNIFLPHLQNRSFIGREDVFLKLHQTAILDTHKPVIQAISGLGGIGKTQIALEYAYRHHADYKAILWISAETCDSIVSDLLAIAQKLDLFKTTRKIPDQGSIIDAVRRWLQTKESWLFILDNVEHLEDIEDLLSLSGPGYILLTTRVETIGGVDHLLKVEKMPHKDGALLLLRQARRLSQNAFLDTAMKEDIEAAQDIVCTLDGLPLALDLAGAYIREEGIEVDAYLDVYHRHRARVLGWWTADSLHANYTYSVATVWALSFERIENQCPVAADLLRLCAFLDPDVIPEDLLLKGTAELGSSLRKLTDNTFELNLAIGHLLRYSLIRRNSKERFLTIHRLVQAVLNDNMNKHEQKQWIDQAIQVVASILSSSPLDPLPPYEQYLLQILFCGELIEQRNCTNDAAGHLLYEAGNYMRQRGWYSQAEQFGKQAVEVYTQMLGAEHPEIATHLNNLALVYEDMRMHKQAEPLFSKALTILSKAFPPDYSKIAAVLSNLAKCYRFQGLLLQAKQIEEQMLVVLEKSGGLTKLDSATLIIERATLYREQGELMTAHDLYLQAVAMYEDILPPDHTYLAQALNALGVNYKLQGQYDQAEKQNQRALAIFEKTLGPDHPDVALCLTSLADVYLSLEKYEEAEQYYQRALTIYEHTVGLEHPDVAEPLFRLALLYLAKGQFSQAEEYCLRAITILEKSQGPEQGEIMLLLRIYAVILEQTGQADASKGIVARADAMQEQLEKQGLL